MPNLAFNVLLTEEDDGTWSAFCLELEGCMSQGSSEREAIEYILDAIQLNIEWLKSEGKPIPSAKADRLREALVIPDDLPENALRAYPDLDPGILHTGHRKTLLVP